MEEDEKTTEADLTVNNISRFNPTNRIVCGYDEAIENAINVYLRSGSTGDNTQSPYAADSRDTCTEK